MVPDFEELIVQLEVLVRGNVGWGEEEGFGGSPEESWVHHIISELVSSNETPTVQGFWEDQKWHRYTDQNSTWSKSGAHLQDGVLAFLG